MVRSHTKSLCRVGRAFVSQGQDRATFHTMAWRWGQVWYKLVTFGKLSLSALVWSPSLERCILVLSPSVRGQADAV